MHLERWGRQKPRFALSAEGELQLENSPVPRTSRGQPHDGTDAVDERGERYVENMYAVGEAILSRMLVECEEREAQLVLVTKLERVRQAFAGRLPLLFVDRALDNVHTRLPDGMKHMSEAGNGILAWEIARFLEEEKLVPARHVLR